jgi:hypothetical protein
MPKRSPTPPRPRRVVRIRRSPTDTSPRSPILVRYGLVGLFAVGGVAVIVVVLAATHGGSSASNVTEQLHAAGCTVRVVDADDPRPHLFTLKAKVAYNTFPPTNGLHYVYWAPWALYRAPVSQLQTVHNLEHGGIVLQYGYRVPESEKSKVRDFYFRDRNGMLVAPLRGLGAEIALEAWTAPPIQKRAKGDFGKGHVALCPRFDEEAFSAFRDAYRYHGPESRKYDRALLEPGL